MLAAIIKFFLFSILYRKKKYFVLIVLKMKAENFHSLQSLSCIIKHKNVSRLQISNRILLMMMLFLETTCAYQLSLAMYIRTYMCVNACTHALRNFETPVCQQTCVFFLPPSLSLFFFFLSKAIIKTRRNFVSHTFIIFSCLLFIFTRLLGSCNNTAAIKLRRNQARIVEIRLFFNLHLL